MACSRSPAIQRLTALYLDGLLADEDFGLRVSLSDALCSENVDAVCKLNLFPEYDQPSVAAAFHDHDRDLAMLRAWVSGVSGRTIQ
jgi:hypothetical protein